MIKESLHYKDVVLNNPQYSECISRRNISTDIFFIDRVFKSPAIPANMKTAIDFKLAEQLAKNGYFYILHRFYDYDEILNWVKETDIEYISISVGVKDVDYKLIKDLSKLPRHPDYITIDIAHGHSSLMKDMIEHIIYTLPNTKIISGNVCTPEACEDLAEWGASACKIGIACGAGCRTYNVTGVGSPMFSTTLDCSIYSPIPIIADGGIRDIADINKALVAGANMIMIGSEFVKCVDSPAEWETDYLKHPISNKKIYFGSASAKNKGKDEYVEGFENVLLETNNLTYLEYYEKIKQGIQSCMSYHNLTDISDMGSIQWSKHNL